MSPQNAPKRGLLSDIRETKYSVPLGLSIAALVSIVLFVIAGLYVCLVPLAIALIMYYVPRFFGLKSRKKLFIFGCVMIVVLSLIYAYSFYYGYSDFDGKAVESDGLELVNGIVTPVHGGAGDSYTFQVTLSSGANDSVVKLLLRNAWTGDDALNLTMNYQNVSGQAVYTRTVALNETGIYNYQFYLSSTPEYNVTDAGLGPISVDSGALLNYSLFNGFLGVFISIGVLFFLLLVLTYWMDRSKDKIEKQMAQRQKATSTSGEKFVCSECGAEVSAEAKECPQCGEKFEDESKSERKEDKKCPKCSSVVFETDKKCWNCGQELSK